MLHRKEDDREGKEGREVELLDRNETRTRRKQENRNVVIASPSLRSLRSLTWVRISWGRSREKLLAWCSRIKKQSNLQRFFLTPLSSPPVFSSCPQKSLLTITRIAWSLSHHLNYHNSISSPLYNHGKTSHQVSHQRKHVCNDTLTSLWYFQNCLLASFPATLFKIFAPPGCSFTNSVTSYTEESTMMYMPFSGDDFAATSAWVMVLDILILEGCGIWGGSVIVVEGLWGVEESERERWRFER